MNAATAFWIGAAAGAVIAWVLLAVALALTRHVMREAIAYPDVISFDDEDLRRFLNNAAR